MNINATESYTIELSRRELYTLYRFVGKISGGGSAPLKITDPEGYLTAARREEIIDLIADLYNKADLVVGDTA